MNNELLKQAQTVFLENFEPETQFNKCIFLSWWCDLSCKFCYRSIDKPKSPEVAKKSMAAIITEALFTKHCGWKHHFLTTGYGTHSQEELIEIAKTVHSVLGYKLGLNIGVVSKEKLEHFRPYVDTVYAAIETVNPEVQKEICPQKPIQPYLDMLKNAEGFKKGLAIVVGIGETLDDIPKLLEIIDEYEVDKLSIYALTPIKGTEFEKGPDLDEYATWIAKIRIAFPKLEITAGIWHDRVEDVETLLHAGANTITKFPALKEFGKENAYAFEEQAQKAGRTFKGTLTHMPDLDWGAEVESLSLNEELTNQVKEKIESNLSRITKEIVIKK